MGVNQKIDFGAPLQTALADAQRILDAMDLRAKIHVDVETGTVSGGIGVDAAMARTEKAAAEASKVIGGGSDQAGPLAPGADLVDAMRRVVKGMEDLAKSMGSGNSGGGGRRGGKKAGEGSDSGPESGSDGYVNPYIAQGLVQNPLSTLKSSMISSMMGGAGGVPPGMMGDIFGGSKGFSLGKALAAPVGSGAWASPLASGALTAAVPIAAFAGTMKMQMSQAEEGGQDATDWRNDLRLGRGMGVNWRSAMYANEFQSRRDIDLEDVKSLSGSMNVGFNTAYQGSQGAWGWGSQMQRGVNTALTIGAAPGAVGSVMGAAVRSGTLDLQSPDWAKNMNQTLGLIEQWTKSARDSGFSTSEALAKMAGLSSMQGAATGGIVTAAAQRSLLSMDRNIAAGLPSEIRRPGTEMVEKELMSAPSGDTQTVQMMNEMVGSDGQLTETGRNWAVESLGESGVASMEKNMGKSSGVFIAQQVISKGGVGAARARTSMIQGMMTSGRSGLAISSVAGSGNNLAASLAMDSIRSGDLFKKNFYNQEGGEEINIGHKIVGEGDNVDMMGKLGLAKMAQVHTVLTGMLSDTSAGLLKLSKDLDVMSRSTMRAIDEMRNAEARVKTIGEYRSETSLLHNLTHQPGRP